MNFFISCFWGQDPLRTKLCIEFSNRYPNIIILQNQVNIGVKNTLIYNYKNDGFVDYKMINEFIKTHDVKTLTLIDSDLILEPLFFYKILNKHRSIDESCMITIKNSYELVNGSIIDIVIKSMVSNDKVSEP